MNHRLRDLPYAAEEAEEVGTILSARVLMGESATEGVVRQALRDPLISLVHFSGHGFFEGEEWAFSRLYLSPSLDGAGIHDGILNAFEVASEISLPNAQLVTLSACETGRGVVIGGDEVLGLPRAFLRAGARRVLATRWRVDDEASKILMVRFYSELTAGAPPLEALRLGKLELLETPHLKDPAHWAAFFLLGDPAPWPMALGMGVLPVP